ncbi:maleylacetate reductase [Saccharopolyspora griseoalba]|uniref:Maleylacetate reductase n=1 Tax=Saccharopolyspora griseoalba TaxID=1431848 RepID=A0ABW2LHM1_9PSEU
MSLEFDHITLAQRVRFGTGKAAENLAAEVERRGSRAVMVIAEIGEADLADRVTARIDVALHHSEVVMHVPAATAEKARAAAQDSGIDLLVSIGGGSTTGLAKAVALTSGLPIVAVPTTYAGSEATNVWGLTEGARKTTGVDDRVLPETVIYDAELTYSLPADLSVASGLNGLAHCVDSLWAPRADPINAALATEGMRTLATGLPQVITDPTAADGRERALYGAYLSAVAFASAGSAMHHKICHVLGGTYDLPHAQTHAIVLPHVLAHNAAAAPEAAGRIAGALGARDAVAGLLRLRDRLGAPKALRDIGLSESDLRGAAELAAAAIPPSNPRPVDVDGVHALLTAAWAGTPPEAAR